MVTAVADKDKNNYYYDEEKYATSNASSNRNPISCTGGYCRLICRNIIR